MGCKHSKNIKISDVGKHKDYHVYHIQKDILSYRPLTYGQLTIIKSLSCQNQFELIELYNSCHNKKKFFKNVWD